MFPCHIALIMDGNGRWAKLHHLPRIAGHRAGMERLRVVVKHAAKLGLQWLTLYAFSLENWSRPKEEVQGLFSLLKLFIQHDLIDLHENNIKIHIIGEREGLDKDIFSSLNEVETLTKQNSGLNLVIAFNYGGRNEIMRATKKITRDVMLGKIKETDINDGLLASYMDTAAIPDPDLIIRTSGELRLSNFLLWQSAYSELSFFPCFWPDFSVDDFDHAVKNFQCRDRRFGGISHYPLLKENSSHGY